MSSTFKSSLSMAEFPSDIMFNIFSRLPAKCLARFRCVSKEWCNYINDPYLEIMHAKRASYDRKIMFQQFPSDPPNSSSPCIISFLEYKDQEAGSCTLEVRKKPSFMEFMSKDLYSRYKGMVLGSCYGLFCSPHADCGYTTTLVVINPLRKECYELPPINTPWHTPENLWWSGFDWSCGLGFDDSTNSFKMVCIPNVHLGIKYSMVHVLGTDSWRKIPHAPSYRILGEGVYAHGCLHWISCDINPRLVIRFDLKNEEFGYIELPKKQVSGWVDEELVDFLGQVGYVYTTMDDDNVIVEVWVLKEGSWVMQGHLKQKPPLPFVSIRFLGLWNENGDILLVTDYNQLFVCNLKSEHLYEAKFVGWEVERACPIDIRIYQSSLFSTRYLIKN